MHNQSVAPALLWSRYLILCVTACSCVGLLGIDQHQIVATTTAPQFDPVVIRVNSSLPDFLNITEEMYTKSGPPRRAYWVHTNYPFRVVNPPPVMVQPWQNYEHENKRWQLWKTSFQSKQFGCDAVAVNGGPFHADGTNCGPTVVDGALIQGTVSSGDLIGFGRTDRGEFLLGSYQQFIDGSKSRASHHGLIQSFITGFHWLVYDGKVVARDDDNGDGSRAQKAARTAIGTTSDGSIVILVVDGCEKW
jgi:Phosphodiester glycosidase